MLREIEGTMRISGHENYEDWKDSLNRRVNYIKKMLENNYRSNLEMMNSGMIEEK